MFVLMSGAERKISLKTNNLSLIVKNRSFIRKPIILYQSLYYLKLNMIGQSTTRSNTKQTCHLSMQNFKDGFWTEAGRGGSLQPCPSQGPWRAWGLGEHVHGLVGLREHVLRIRGMGENDFRPRKQSLRLDRTQEHGLGHGGAQQHCVAGHVGGPQHHVREHLVGHCGGGSRRAGEH